MVKINGVDLPKYPSEFSVAISDLDDGATSGRTMDGTMHRDRIAIKQKLSLSFNVLLNDEVAILLQMISDIFFDVTYPNPYTGGETTIECYVGDRTAPVAFYNKAGVLVWRDIAFNLIER
jgi:hypothetical protein